MFASGYFLPSQFVIQNAPIFLWHLCGFASFYRGPMPHLWEKLWQTLWWSPGGGVFSCQRLWHSRQGWGKWHRQLVITLQPSISQVLVGKHAINSISSRCLLLWKVYIRGGWAGCPYLRSCVEQTRLAVGGRDGRKWASSVHWQRGSVGQRECGWWWGSSRHGSRQVKLKQAARVFQASVFILKYKCNKRQSFSSCGFCSSKMLICGLVFIGSDLRELTQLRELWMLSLSCWRNMVRADRAWRMSAASPTTTVFSSQTGEKLGCWKHPGNTGQH